MESLEEQLGVSTKRIRSVDAHDDASDFVTDKTTDDETSVMHKASKPVVIDLTGDDDDNAPKPVVIDLAVDDDE